MFWRLLFGSIVRQADGLGGGGGPDVDALPGAPPLDLSMIDPSQPGVAPDDGMGEHTPPAGTPGVPANQQVLDPDSGPAFDILDDAAAEELGLDVTGDGDVAGDQPTGGEPRGAAQPQPQAGQAVYRTAGGADVTGEDIEALMIRAAALEREVDGAGRREPAREPEPQQTQPDEDEIPELKLPDNWDELSAEERIDWQNDQIRDDRARQRAVKAKQKAHTEARQAVERQQQTIQTIREGIETGSELKFIDNLDAKAIGVEPAKLRQAAAVAATGMGLLLGGVTNQDNSVGDVSRRFTKTFLRDVVLPFARAIALSKAKAGGRPATAGRGGRTDLQRTASGGMRMPVNPTPADDRALFARAREAATAQRLARGID